MFRLKCLRIEDYCLFKICDIKQMAALWCSICVKIYGIFFIVYGVNFCEGDMGEARC